MISPTNGLYINRSVEALGKEKKYQLCDGDLLAFGDYEISVTLLDEQPAMAPSAQAQTQESAPTGYQGKGIAVNSLFEENPTGRDEKQEPGQPPLSHVQQGLDDHFSLPQASIPKEWELELLGKTAQGEPAGPEAFSPRDGGGPGARFSKGLCRKR